MVAAVAGLEPLTAANPAEATSMGAAMIGGVGSGLLQGFDDVDRFRSVERVVEPDPAAHERYSELLSIFADTYRALESEFNRLADF